MFNVRAILLMVVAMAGFAVEDAFVKLMAQDLHQGQIMFMMGLLAFLVIWAIAASQGQSVFNRHFFHKTVLLRNGVEMLGTTGFVLSITLAPLTLSTAIFQATPLAVTLGAALFLKEQVGWRRWSAITVGFIGVLIVIRPGFEGFDPNALWGLLAVVCLAARDLVTRVIPREINSYALSAWGFGATGVVGLIIIAFAQDLAVPSAAENLWLIGSVLTGVVGYFALTVATRIGEVSAIVPFRYTRLLFALGIGFFVFGETPDLWMLIGSALIVGSGLYSLARERKRRREALSQA